MEKVQLSAEQRAAIRDNVHHEENNSSKLFTQTQLQMVTDQLESALADDQVTRVTYNDFKVNGLPILLTVHREFDVLAWVKYVGQPYVRLEVLGADGQVMYTIPSMYRQLPTAAGTFDNRYLDHVNELSAIRIDSPEVAARVQYNHLVKINSTNVDDDINEGLEALNAINKVFSDHGYPTFTYDSETGGLKANAALDPTVPVPDVAVPSNPKIVVSEDNDFSENLEEL